MKEKKIVKNYGKCQVTITFNEQNSDSLKRVMWLLIESYCDRVKCTLEGFPVNIEKRIEVS